MTQALLADLRSRINPAYQDVRGTESYERKQCADSIESLLARLDKAEKDAERLLPLLKQALSVVDGSYNEDHDEAFEGSVSESLRAEISAMEASK